MALLCGQDCPRLYSCLIDLTARQPIWVKLCRNELWKKMRQKYTEPKHSEI